MKKKILQLYFLVAAFFGLMDIHHAYAAHEKDILIQNVTALDSLASHMGFHNVTPLQIAGVPSAVKEAGSISILPTKFPDMPSADSLISAAVPSLVSYMKNPYILLVATEGIAVACVLFGQQVPQPEIGRELQQHFKTQLSAFATPVMAGAAYGLTEVGTSQLLKKNYSAYVSPLIIGGALAGLGLSYFTSDVKDQNVELVKGGLAGLMLPALESIAAELPEQKQKVIQAISDLQKNVSRVTKRLGLDFESAGHRQAGKSHAVVNFAKKAALPVAAAIISVAGGATAIQAFQSGDLSLESQVVAGMTLANAVNLLEGAVAYEYGTRFAKKGFELAQRATDQCKNIVTGVARLFDWAELPTCM